MFEEYTQNYKNMYIAKLYMLCSLSTYATLDC